MVVELPIEAGAAQAISHWRGEIARAKEAQLSWGEIAGHHHRQRSCVRLMQKAADLAPLQITPLHPELIDKQRPGTLDAGARINLLMPLHLIHLV